MQKRREEFLELVSKTKDIKVLFAEDDIEVRESICEVLDYFFTTIDKASDGQEAFEKFSTKNYDLIISDIRMSKLDGIELTKKIRDIDEDIPIILLTAYTEKDYILQSIDLGIDGYIHKPLEIDKLTFHLKRILNVIDTKRQKDFEQNSLLSIINENIIMSKTDLNGVITYVSDAFCKISGYTKDELIGQTHSILRDKDMPDELYMYMWMLISNDEVWEGELKNRTKSGKVYWVSATIKPEYNYRGEKIGYLSIQRDIATQKEIEILNTSLELKIEEANRSLANTLRHTRDSIEYAALIQSSLVPNNEIFRKYFSEYFVIWHPKDVVGGDIYLFNELRDDTECLLMCLDCTGHGVPGAFVTMLVKAVEFQLMAEIYSKPEMEISTAWIMGFFNNKLKTLLNQHSDGSISNVGFDGSIIYYNKQTGLIKFTGAESVMFYRRPNGEIVTLKGSRKSVGYKQVPYDYKYKEVIFPVEEGMKLYLTTDGYLDQNGGEKGFPFGKKRFVNIIEEYGEESMADQQEMFLYELDEYENSIEDNDRNDDITVIGLTI